MTLGSKLNQPPLRLLVFVWLYIFCTGRICVFWREHTKNFLNVGTFTLEIKNKKLKFYAYLCHSTVVLLLHYENVLYKHLQIALCYFQRESQVNETYAPSNSLSTVCVYEVIEIYISTSGLKEAMGYHYVLGLIWWKAKF